MARVMTVGAEGPLHSPLAICTGTGNVGSLIFHVDNYTFGGTVMLQQQDRLDPNEGFKRSLRSPGIWFAASQGHGGQRPAFAPSAGRPCLPVPGRWRVGPPPPFCLRSGFGVGRRGGGGRSRIVGSGGVDARHAVHRTLEPAS